MLERCCYVNSVSDFMNEEADTWLKSMTNRFNKIMNLPLGDSQITAWKDCFKVLKDELRFFVLNNPSYGIIFEYVLPYESGRRPDVLLVSNEQVIVLEFKQYGMEKRADLDQVKAYARDLSEYHYETRGKEVVPILVLTGRKDGRLTKDVMSGVRLCSRDMLSKVLEEVVNANATVCDMDRWISSRYEPLPSIVEAAKMFYRNEDLPQIRRVNSTCIPDAINSLKVITKDAKENEKHVVVFVTGVPGAGKTFLGLQYVYDVCKDVNVPNAVYLSGNGPLVEVLKSALHTGVFVKDLHGVINEYLDRGAQDFSNNIIVFDEGQRAWTKDRMADRRNVDKSEPQVMIELCENRLDWCVLLVLVGEGQEIHTGENGGIGQWNIALNCASKKWEVACSDKIRSIFSDQELYDSGKCSSLNLSQSLRTHLAGDVSEFINELLAGNIAKAKILAKTVKREGFNMYVTRDLNKAKTYVMDRYADEPQKQYGMIASSKASDLPKFGMDNSFYGAISTGRYGYWFNGPESRPEYCCNLTRVVTEFGCQGLEIDMPIIGWGKDFKWQNGAWSKYKAKEADGSEANMYRKNSYRVLLTRGRDGFVIFVPDEREMDSTYELLKDILMQ